MTKLAPVNLGDHCTLITKGTTPKTLGIEFSETGIPFIRIEDLVDGTIRVSETTRFIDEAADMMLGRSRIYPGDVLVSIAGTIGRTAVVPDSLPRLNCNQALAIVRPSRGIDPNFLRHWFGSPSARRQMEEAKVSATISNLSLTQIGRLQICLPALKEQQRIAAILDKTDSLRRKRQEAIRLAEEFLRAVFIDMFGYPGANNQGLPVRRLGDVCRFYAGNSLPTSEPFVGQAGGILHIKVGDMNLPGNETDIHVAREWSSSGAGGIIAPEGAILIPKRGGAIATNKKRVLRRPCALDPNLMAIGPGDELRQEVLFEWFRQFDLSSISSGSAVPQLNKGDLAPLKINVAPLAMQDKFVQVARNVKSMLERQGAQLTLIQSASAALTSTLLHAGSAND